MNFFCTKCLKTNEFGLTLDQKHFCKVCGRTTSQPLQPLPVVSVGMMGLPGHGKTVYVLSTIRCLRQQASKVFRDLSIEPLTEPAAEFLFTTLRDFEESGSLPEATPVAEEQPFLFKISGFLDQDPFYLVFLDVSGEAYQDSEVFQETVKRIQKSSAVSLLFNPKLGGQDFLSERSIVQASMDLEKMLYVYKNGGRSSTASVQGEPSDQRLQFVLTAADLYFEDLPEEVQEHMLTPFPSVEEIAENSARVREWLRKTDLSLLINLAEGHFKKVDYFVVSALGQQPVTDGGYGRIVDLSPTAPKALLNPLVILTQEQLALQRAPETKKPKRRLFFFWKRAYA